jgi:hypothetical protein
MIITAYYSEWKLIKVSIDKKYNLASEEAVNASRVQFSQITGKR